MSNRRYNATPAKQKFTLIDDDEQPEWLRDFHEAKAMAHPHQCDLVTCGIVFEKHDSVSGKLPRRLYCSSICAWRDESTPGNCFGRACSLIGLRRP